MATCLPPAMFSGPWPVLRRARSSWKPTSRNPVQAVLDVPVGAHRARRSWRRAVPTADNSAARNWPCLRSRPRPMAVSPGRHQVQRLLPGAARRAAARRLAVDCHDVGRILAHALDPLREAIRSRVADTAPSPAAADRPAQKMLDKRRVRTLFHETPPMKRRLIVHVHSQSQIPKPFHPIALRQRPCRLALMR